jgi:hypothetical protein
MELEGSILCPQEPATDSYTEADESNPHLPTLFIQDPSYYYPPTSEV